MTVYISPGRRHLFTIAILLALAAAIFGQSLSHEFIALDDGLYVARNPHISDHLSWQGLRWAVSDVKVSNWNWHPVTTLSHLLVAAAFGLEPGPHHAVNVVLHGLNACLLYAVLLRFTAAWWPSVVAALLFTVHPLRVESVAWVSERKGLLCAFFALLTLLAYERYIRRPGVVAYLGVALAFLLALLSKSAVVALPFAMLLLDYWPLRRFEVASTPLAHRALALVREKIPLFAMSAVVCVVTYVVQHRSGAVQGIGRYPVGVRFANAVVSYTKYVADTLVPFHLAPQYPHPGQAIYGPELYVSALVIVGLTAAAALAWRRCPWFAVGWLWFCGMLVPAIGLVQVANQARADRYTYLPQIGLLIAIAWGLDDLRRRFPAAARPATVAVALWVITLAAAAFVQAGRWRDDFTLFSYTVALSPESSQAHYSLGVAFVARGDLENAEKSFREAIEHTPLLPEAFSNLGAIELRRGDFAQSAEHFARAAELDGSNPDLLVNYGIALFNLGRRAEAELLAARALQLAPDHPRALELRAACRASSKP